MIKDLSQLNRIDLSLRQWERTYTRFPDASIARVANAPDSLLLVSIPKCGTTWLRYLLANYSRQLRTPAAEAVRFDELAEYWQERDFLIKGRDRPRALTPAFPGVNSMLYQHPWRGGRLHHDIWCHQGPKLSIVRNPLDFVVSCYFFYIANRDVNLGKADHPRDLIPAYTRLFAACYRFIRDGLVPSGAVLVAYEHLKTDTSGTLELALENLRLPVAPEALRRATYLSTAERAASDEEARGQTLVVQLDRGSFVRDGSVGQWRNYFTDSEVDAVRDILAERRIKLDEEFVLDTGPPSDR